MKKNPVQNTQPNGNKYALGDSASERERLKRQAQRLSTLSDRFLIDAGLQPGMRVLELGGGSGYFSKLIAERVGPNGQVVALERSSAMLVEARENLAEWHHSNIEFIECDIEQSMLELTPSFDAIVGRLILTHLQDPINVLRHAVEYVKSGGIVAFQEADVTLSEHLLDKGRKDLPLVHQVNAWLNLAQESSTRQPHLGLQLFEVFQQAGLPSPKVYLHTELQSGVSPGRVQSTLTLLRNLMPELEKRGITAAEIDIETLEARLTAELTNSKAVQAHTSIASAWTTKSLA